MSLDSKADIFGIAQYVEALKEFGPFEISFDPKRAPIFEVGDRVMYECETWFVLRVWFPLGKNQFSYDICKDGDVKNLVLEGDLRKSGEWDSEAI